MVERSLVKLKSCYRIALKQICKKEVIADSIDQSSGRDKAYGAKAENCVV